MMSGDGEEAGVPAPVAPAVGAQQPAGVAPVELPIDDPAAAVDLIEGGGLAAPPAQDVSQLPPQTVDYAALGINPDGELTPEQDGTVARISQADAEAKLGNDGVVWVDVRSAQEFEQSHIPGSLSVPAYTNDDGLAELPKDAEILVYCA